MIQVGETVPSLQTVHFFFHAACTTHQEHCMEQLPWFRIPLQHQIRQSQLHHPLTQRLLLRQIWHNLRRNQRKLLKRSKPKCLNQSSNLLQQMPLRIQVKHLQVAARSRVQLQDPPMRTMILHLIQTKARAKRLQTPTTIHNRARSRIQVKAKEAPTMPVRQVVKISQPALKYRLQRILKKWHLLLNPCLKLLSISVGHKQVQHWAASSMAP